MYQSTTPPSYSCAAKEPESVAGPAANRYSMRSGDHASPPAGSENSEAYQAIQVRVTASTES